MGAIFHLTRVCIVWVSCGGYERALLYRGFPVVAFFIPIPQLAGYRLACEKV